MSSSFTSTRWSQVLAAGSADQVASSAALAWLCERYWEPLRRAARRWGVAEDQAEDCVQDFCCRLVERRVDLGCLDPGGGRFRAWLITVFRRFVSDRRTHAAALMRGGGARHQDPTRVEVAAPVVDTVFDHDWAEVILASARARLASESEGEAERARHRLLSVFLVRNTEPGDYARIGRELALTEGAMKVAVHRLRQRFGDLVRQEIADTLVDPSPQAIDDELAALVAARRIHR